MQRHTCACASTASMSSQIYNAEQVDIQKRCWHPLSSPWCSTPVAQGVQKEGDLAHIPDALSNDPRLHRGVYLDSVFSALPRVQGDC